MTCDEFERVLPELEGTHSLEQEEHLRTCSACSALLADLNAISQQARLLAEERDPSPHVWNSIEISLRQKGLIREPRLQPVPVAAARRSSWRFPWLVPITAGLLWGAGLLYFHQVGKNQPRVAEAPAVVSPVTKAPLQPAQATALLADEDQLLQIVSARAPGLGASYESDLRAVNAYIRDAEQSAQNDPNDEIAQQYLMNAYEQRAMVYEMAMNRAMP
jgi:hypothetical protein